MLLQVGIKYEYIASNFIGLVQVVSVSLLI